MNNLTNHLPSTFFGGMKKEHYWGMRGVGCAAESWLLGTDISQSKNGGFTFIKLFLALNASTVNAEMVPVLR